MTGDSKWEPWVGENYADRRLLLLGESAYSWNEDGQLMHPTPDHAGKSVEWAIGEFPTARFMNMLTRALALEEWPETTGLRAAWARTAFVNYVSETVGDGPRSRPSVEQWQEAERRFGSLINSLRPKNIIVLGKDLWSNMPPTDLYLTEDVQGYKLDNGETTMCWALPHPAAGLSWKRLAATIAFACDRRCWYSN